MIPSIRVVPFLGVLVTACLLATVFFYFEQEKRIEPEPFTVSELKQLGDMSQLRPHMQRLMEAVRAEELLGAPADDFRSDLDLADETRASKRTSTYVFYAHPEAGYQEGHPCLFVVTQNRFGHIFRVGVTVPEW